VALGILAASAGALPCAGARAQTPGSATAVVVKAGSGCFTLSARTTGLVVPRAEAIVNLNVDGYQISEVLVAEGERTTAGQVLAKLTRMGGDGKGGAAQASQGGAGAGAQQRPATMPLLSPAAGLVSRSTAKVGMVASPMPLPPPMGPEPLFRIIVNNELEVEGDVPSAQLPKLNPGQPARVQLDNGREVTGRVRIVLPEIDRKTQLGKVRVSLENDPAIRSGMFARATINASQSCGVSVPRTAVRLGSEAATVQVVKDDMVETRQIRLGFYSNADVEVREGVKEGELVIANAGTSLHDGDRVKPILADEAGQAGGR